LGLKGVRDIRHVHPTSRGARFFRGETPLGRVNDALQEVGEEPINWWPPAEPGA
jgi:uracil DNA glycosylase